MKGKKILLWLLFLLIIAGGGYILYERGVFDKKDPIYIAVSALGDDVSETWTTQLNESVQMYVDEANAAGGINGHPIEIIPYIDGGTADGAKAVAEQIIQEDKAIIVLGNSYSDAATEMGSMLAENEIPGISSGATAPSVTEGNDWFFRVINDNTAQGSFVAQYAKIFFEYESAIIFYENNTYGESLGMAFGDEFETNGGTVISTSPVSANESLEENIETIISSSDAMPDMFLLGTYKSSGSRIVIYLREHYPEIPIFGGDSLGADSFAEKVAEQLGTSKTGGIIDDVYAPSQVIFDVASEDAQVFRDAYIKNIDNKITWFAATSYDSALVAIEAMRKAGISGEATQVEQDRQLLRDYLDSVNQKDEGFEGITGKIYFDENHNFTQPLAMGLFDNDKFISAPVQLYSIEKEDLPDDYGKKIASGHIIRQNGQYFGKTRIVYVGVDINEFDDIDVDGEHTYFVDFYLWFRYKGEKLDFSEVKFDNSVKDLSLDSPLEEKEFGDTHYILFKVRETFRNSFDLSDYPFDHQRLPIKLRHSSLERKNLIFVTDILGLGPITEDNIKNTLKRSDAFETTTDWNVVTGFFFSDSVHDFGTRGDPTQFDKKSEIEHSRFTAAIEVKRDVIGFTSKTMMPVFWIILLAYLGLFLPGREFDTITGLMTGTVLSVVFFHVGLAGRLNVGYTVALDYAFYIIYALLATELFLSIVAWHRSVKNKDDNAIKAIFWLMRFLYPAVIIGMVIYAIIHYKVIL
ncbi:MAG: ABC transporter substrate-binding protein [Anaerolineae bacterium]|jgi:branched-chain amino acid transport system substrate-binding protein|nr:ABC transporter substrate-binding protein [Anaerolineae bacterium]MBT7073901.1 ABC transporter substrate-binding protein [Anaerolineae bacterium]MBT7782867.1 ABC transporter substrate-binding protein [Anaerolineae bacterium]